MTYMIARLLLSMLLLPLAGAVIVGFIAFFASGQTAGPPSFTELLAMWTTSYAFIAVYWILLWKSVVRWNPRRAMRTLSAGLVAAFTFCGVVVIARSMPGTRYFPVLFFGGGIPPIVWVLATVLIWRETPEERHQRISAAGGDTICCPICGYNLTGLQECRCPECGSKFTLDALLASQREDESAIPTEDRLAAR